MRSPALGTILMCALGWGVSAAAQQQAPAGPANAKAQKTYQSALQFARRGMNEEALGAFKKADKQDGGECALCQAAVVKYGVELQDWNAATQAAQEEIAHAHGNRDLALAHYDMGYVLMQEGLLKHKQEILTRSHEELAEAVAAAPNFPDAIFLDGRVLAELHQDATAKAEFAQFVKMAPADTPDRGRAERYLSDIELARERMAPAFAATTLDGQRVSLDGLHGKVVLLDFWATWCAPCRAALPRMQRIARTFQGRPLVILSVSLDSDAQKWKDFVAKNGMTWLNYRDGGFDGPIANLFGVKAIPHTFTIDAHGVLRDEQIGDASIEGRLKKLVAQAERENAQPPPPQ